ncbi:hypothetical protein Csa_019906 [Cucumis sativus]|uniref:Retrotransposon Copia-like N-terminal domain-containing protein n=1 Tax=Cucumis sativus TaxID=3659 RepID=A0A0A0LXU0_CUCSA|nr:hypothetical protein Csa_019906 [Cucumis sativus]
MSCLILAENNTTTKIQNTSVTIAPTYTAINTSFGHPLDTSLSIKLDDKKFGLWRGMVLAVLRGQKVDGYVLGAKSQPPQSLKSNDEASSSTSVLIQPLKNRQQQIKLFLDGYMVQ